VKRVEEICATQNDVQNKIAQLGKLAANAGTDQHLVSHVL
jgi:hypothetical protein